MLKVAGNFDRRQRQTALFTVSKDGRAATLNRKTVPGSMNLDLQIREAISQALKESPLSRHQVAAELSRTTGCDVSKPVLDSFSAESAHGHRWPAAYTPAFCTITGNYDIIRLICSEAGGCFIPDVETLKLELREVEAEKRQLRDRERLILDLIQTLGSEEAGSHE